jgi:hypothetical protein
MNCPKCNLPTVKLGAVECRTGNCEKRGCPKCRAIFFKQTEHRQYSGDYPPLHQTLDHLARLATA